MRDKLIIKKRNESYNPSRKKLEEGLARINCKHRAAYINAVMCLRRGKSTGADSFDYQYIENCKKIVEAHIEVIKPKVIVTMGWEVTKRYVDDSNRFTGLFKDIVNREVRSDKYNAWLLPIYHLGTYGQLNKKRAKKENEDEFCLIKRLLQKEI